jgi:fermentation-respiration switch protein FrsA (DUF1100 family)
MLRYLLVLLLVVCCCTPIPTLEDMVLRPNPNLATNPAEMGYVFEEVVLPIDEARSVIVWHVKSNNPRALFFIIPGSDANKSLYCEALPLFVPEGLDVLLMDYEGYGNSPGETSFQHCLDDAAVVAQYAVTLHPKVIAYGVSLGTPLLARVATDQTFAGCIFEGSVIFDQEADLWMRDNSILYNPFFGFIGNSFVSIQMPEGYDILKYIQTVDEPKLFIHSTEDEVTPYSGGLLVFESSFEPKEFWTVYGDHGKMVRLDTEAYKQRVLAFIDQTLSQ